MFLFNDTATTEIYTLSLHDALPIFAAGHCPLGRTAGGRGGRYRARRTRPTLLTACCPSGGIRRPERTDQRRRCGRSEEHTSELQSRQYLVCRLLLEKKKTSYAYTN